ncbi:methyltransferase type 12 [Grosmannia clavigera kw1407]|uniref:Methyltransferase type 12 n=1 Tax=Grosmannia clavigera (strain kw1407 / UAMH 11150) TaxID=655863 RepID=F0XCV6_GROCL|nr:methyltransferase type 12 [Grosmannia clavigera kw1407]EFX04700.1 methyltransferase type 12 [Grosmannia clavigera kw1407]
MMTVQPQMSTVEVFDSVGPAYEDAFHGLSTQAASLRWLLAQLPAAGGARVVDVGCGTGRPVVSTLADAGHDVLGIDISPAMLEAARERVPRGRFELIDARDYVRREETSRTGTLHAVTIYFSLIAGVSQQDIRALLAGFGRLLRPGGSLVFATVPLPVENKAIRWMGRPVTVSSLAPEDALASVRAAGLRVVHHEQTTFWPRSAEAGICRPEDVWEEPHLFVYAKKPE